MKRTFLIITTILYSQLSHTQILTDSLIVVEPTPSDLEFTVEQSDIQNEKIPRREVSSSGDTVFIREIVYDTIYMSSPTENLEIEDRHDFGHFEDSKPERNRRESNIKTLAGQSETVAVLLSFNGYYYNT